MVKGTLLRIPRHRAGDTELGKQVDSLNKKKIDPVNDIYKKAVGNKYNIIMQYMDSKQDRETLNMAYINYKCYLCY